MVPLVIRAILQEHQTATRRLLGMIGKHALPAAAVVAALMTGAAAQTAAPPADPKACAPGERLTQRDIRRDTKVSPSETLSDKLARTDGVLCPPPVDPEMSEKPREGGAMKVIPPPGTPEHKPNVRPK